MVLSKFKEFVKDKKAKNSNGSTDESDQIDSVAGEADKSQDASHASQAEGEPIGRSNCFDLTEKFKKDKVALDLVVAVDQVIRDRELSEHKLNELQSRFDHSKTQGHLLSNEINHLTRLLAEREKQIETFEAKLGDKNIEIDQLMEDLRELQSRMSAEIRELKAVVEIERGKYSKLQEQYKIEMSKATMSIKQSEEKLASMESKANTLTRLYEDVRKENTYLLNMVNEFTNRMTVTFGQFSGKEAGGKQAKGEN